MILHVIDDCCTCPFHHSVHLDPHQSDLTPKGCSSPRIGYRVFTAQEQAAVCDDYRLAKYIPPWCPMVDVGVYVTVSRPKDDEDKT